MPRDRKVTVDELPVHPASPSGAAEAKGAGQDGAFGDFGAVAKELVSPPATPDLALMAGMRLVASIQDTRLSLAARSATLSHSLALPAGELTGSIGITDGRQDPFLLSRAPAAMTLGLNLARDAPTHGAGLLSCAVEVDAAQRTGSVSSAMAFLGGRLKAGAAATVARLSPNPEVPPRRPVDRCRDRRPLSARKYACDPLGARVDKKRRAPNDSK